MSNQYDYDAVIIGAGIGGLTCGCYLAKAGWKFKFNEYIAIHHMIQHNV